MKISNKVKIYVKFFILKFKWRNKNKMNFTQPLHLCDIDKIDIGDYTYGGIDAESFGCEESHLYIGRFCSIAQNVKFILDGEHEYHYISTYPFQVRLFGKKVEAKCKGPIIIDDDVWIGERVVILSGVHIGQGAIIAAGSIVTKDVPPYGIYAGGKIIKFRFNNEIIKEMLNIDYSKISPSFIKENLNLFYSDVDKQNIQEIKKKIIGKR